MPSSKCGDVVEHNCCNLIISCVTLQSSCTWQWRPTYGKNGLILFPQSRDNSEAKLFICLFSIREIFSFPCLFQLRACSELPSLLLLYQYPDVFGRCGIALDVWMLPVGDDIYQNSVQQPLLFINSEKFQWAENILKIKRLISNDTNKKMITIK